MESQTPKPGLQKPRPDKSGTFVVVDGIDGVGKGVILDTLVQAAREYGKRVFDVHDYWKSHNWHPPVAEIAGNYDFIVTSEPTYLGVGRYIRNELIGDNSRHYSPEAVAEAYALDRWILYEKLLLPVLKAGVNVLQSRSFSTSIVYQRQSAMNEGRDFSIGQIMRLPGNAFCAQRPMDHLLILTIADAEEALRRARSREKDDNCAFENLDFQLKIKPHFESEEFRSFFKQLGTSVHYLDVGVSIEHSKKQARDFYCRHLKRD